MTEIRACFMSTYFSCSLTKGTHSKTNTSISKSYMHNAICCKAVHLQLKHSKTIEFLFIIRYLVGIVFFHDDIPIFYFKPHYLLIATLFVIDRALDNDKVSLGKLLTILPLSVHIITTTIQIILLLHKNDLMS